MERRHGSRPVKLHGLSIILVLPFLSVTIKINLLIIPFVVMAALSGHIGKYLMVYCCMAAHESAHMLAARLNGSIVSSVSFLPTGMSAEIRDNWSVSIGRIAVLAAGPAFNLLLVAILSLYKAGDIRDFLILMNMLLAGFNLIPVLPLDGGRIFQCILARKNGFLFAGKWAYLVSKVFSAVVMTAGLLQLLTSRNNFSLLFIGIYIVFSLGEEKTEAAFVNVKHIIYRCSRFEKKGVYPVRELVAMKSLQLCEIIKEMDFDRVHIVHVLNDEFNIIGTFTEQEIIEELLNSKPGITFEELVEKKEKPSSKTSPPSI